MSAAYLNIAGVLVTLLGLLLLFRGMSYGAKIEGEIGMVLRKKNEAELKVEKRYRFLEWIGLMLVVLGTLFIPLSYDSIRLIYLQLCAADGMLNNLRAIPGGQGR
jgi:hypothetical protein